MNSFQQFKGWKPDRAFTLVELLAVVTIVGVLIAIGLGTLSSGLKKAQTMREVAAAKNLITAFQQYSAENNGAILPGMDRRTGGADNPIWFEPYKRNVTGAMNEAAHRYPFRLAPYFNYLLEGTILLDSNEKAIVKAGGRPVGQENPDGDYLISLYPALGMNQAYVGGTWAMDPKEGKFVLNDENEVYSRQGQADVALIVFVSAGAKQGGSSLPGYFKVDPPTGLSTGTPKSWSAAAWKQGANPGNYGYVDARHDGKAVCAFSNGAVKMLSIDDLRDMRLWSKNAALTDNSTYAFPR